MQSGFIKMYNSLKGFGFIVTDDDDDIYFSKQDIHPKYKNTALREGLKVGFDVKREARGGPGGECAGIRLTAKKQDDKPNGISPVGR